jgi:hypothetical protein
MGKHNFEQIGGSKLFRPWGHWTEGDSLVGKFTGTSEDNFGNTNYDIEVEECEFERERIVTQNKKNEAVTYVAPKEGEVFCLNSCGSLDKAMEKCDIGDTVKVIYTGTVILNKGKFAGKEAHTMKVLRAASRPAKSAPVSEEDEDIL